MQGTGAEQSVVVMRRSKDRGAKGLRYPVGLICQLAREGAYELGKGFYHTKCFECGLIDAVPTLRFTASQV